MTPMHSSYTVQVPATSANLGPGFDCLGVALALHNTFHFSGAEELRITAAKGLSSAADNLAYQSFRHLFELLGQPIPPIHLEITAKVPLSRGLGSSATAIVGGLLGANAWLANPLTVQELLDIATNLEGHPDNVAPALLGGCCLSVMAGDNVLSVEVPWPEQVLCMVVIPDFTLSTAAARAVLPQTFSRAEAIFNSSRVGLLTLALTLGKPQWLGQALEDCWHQPYRTQLVPGMTEVFAQAQAAGAYGVVLSGAGPTLLALCPPDLCQSIGESMVKTWQELGIVAQALPLAVTQGAMVISS